MGKLILTTTVYAIYALVAGASLWSSMEEVRSCRAYRKFLKNIGTVPPSPNAYPETPAEEAQPTA